ncbi:MAG: hypothetical protein MZW92_63580 [Comamonadaceae bacterium]|nr:hypothetical protein [Comamonadaceae bacterium]
MLVALAIVAVALGAGLRAGRRADRQRAAPGRRQRRAVVRREPASPGCAWRASSRASATPTSSCEQLGRSYRGKLVDAADAEPELPPRRRARSADDDGRRC